jgi:hypothetical protein
MAFPIQLGEHSMTTSDESKMPLGQVFDSVEVTPGEGAQILNALAANLRDSSPNLHASLTSAAADLLDPSVERESDTPRGHAGTPTTSGKINTTGVDSDPDAGETTTHRTGSAGSGTSGSGGTSTGSSTSSKNPPSSA